MKTMEQELEEAVKFHGHLCGGQILGVRMARLALRELGIEEPAYYRDLIVYVEVDRCLADAVLVVTKRTMGRRRLKWMDYGKMGATFVDIPKEDLPGKPMQTVQCDRCGEKIHDCRQVVRYNETLCRGCADGAYYQSIQ